MLRTVDILGALVNLTNTLPSGVSWGLPENRLGNLPELVQVWSANGKPTSSAVIYLSAMVRNSSTTWTHAVLIQEDDSLDDIIQHVSEAAEKLADVRVAIVKANRIASELINDANLRGHRLQNNSTGLN